MAHTKVTKTGTQNTGAVNTFSYSGSFDVFKATEVEVELDNVKLTYTTSTINESASPREYTVDATAKTIHIGGADLAGSNSVVLQPVTDMGAPTPRASYTPGASITSDDLNNNQLQLMRKAMEYDEQKLSSRGGTMTGNLQLGKNIDITFEGDTDDAYETTLTVTDPTADRTITFPNVSGNVVTTGDTATVTATMLAANSVDSDELVNGSVDLSHMSANSVDTTQLVNGAVESAKLANNIDIAGTLDVTGNVTCDSAFQVKADNQSFHIRNAANESKFNIDTDNGNTVIQGTLTVIGDTTLANSSIGSAEIADAAVISSKLADDSVDSNHLVANSIDNEHLSDNCVQTSDINNASVTLDKVENITDGKIIVGNGSDRPTAVTVSGDVTLANTGAVTIQTGAVEHAMLGGDCVEADNIADNAIGTEHIADAELTTLAGMQSGTASVLADSTALAATTAEINSVCENRTGETTITDSDAKIPTSGAVVDYVAAQIAPIGGLEVIANDASFPEVQPAAGVVISIADAGGLVVNGSGVSTTGRTVASTPATVTINGINSAFYSKTVDAGVSFMVSSTGSGQIYNFHKATLKEADILNLSNDINDFGNRYRVHAGEPSSNNDEGDLVYDTNADKMKVYDSTTSAWKEVTSTGDFKYLFLCPAGGTGAPTINGSIATYDLREGSNSGAAASVTNAAQLIVSVNGVVQKANTGTSAPAEGFALVDANTIIFSANLPTGASVFIHQAGSAVSIPTPGDDTVSTVKIQNLAVTTGKIADNAVSLTKLSDGTQGGILYYGASGAPTELAAGTNGYYLKTQGGSANPVWAAVSQYSTPLTTRGDVLFRDASGDQRLAAGTSGQYLQTKGSGADPVWADVQGAVANGCIYENDDEITSDYTIAADKRGHTVGPVTVSATVTVNGYWVIS